MMTRGIDPGKEMRGTGISVHFRRMYRSRANYASMAAFASWHKYCGTQAFARQGGEASTRRAQVQNQTKYRLPSKVWWPGANRDDEKFCRVFHGDSFSILRGCYCDV